MVQAPPLTLHLHRLSIQTAPMLRQAQYRAGMRAQNETGPISSRTELETASLERIASHMRWELRRLLDGGTTQEALAVEVLEYSSASQLNKILHGTAYLPTGKCAILDREGFQPSIPETTYGELAQMLVTRRRRRAPNTSGVWDVFLALPMASTDDDAAFRRVQTDAEMLVKALESHCGFSVYCGALQVKGRDDFDSPAFALTDNVEALRQAEHFLLWVDMPITKPSSVWVEAGLALAMGKPGVYLVREPDVLPYILRQAADARIPGLGSVRYEWIGDEPPATRVRRHGHKLFAL